MIDLSGEWYINFEDNTEFSKEEYVHTSWEIVDVPSNIRNFESSSRGYFWLRKNFEIQNINQSNTQAFTLGVVYDKDEVYLNGNLIGVNGKTANDIEQNEVAYGRPRIYPIPSDLLKIGQNTLAIRIHSNFRTYAGIVTGNVGIAPYYLLSSHLFKRSLDDAIFDAIYLFIGIFFIIGFLKLNELREYLYFSIFIISFAILQFTRNEFRFGIGNYFLVFKFLETALLLNMPFLYILFFHEFFKVKKIKYQEYYFLLNLGFTVLLLIIPNYTFWADFLSYWIINIFLILCYSLYISIIKAMEKNRDAILYTIALGYFMVSVFLEILSQRGFIQVDSPIEFAVLFYIIIVTIALRLRFILLKVVIQKRFKQLKEIDILREKIFLYMDRILSGVIDESIMITRALKNNINPMTTAETVSKVQFNYAEVQLALDDILELSRLEVMSEPISKETVEFVDFIRMILSQARITYTIRVDEKFQIHNSLDLVNSLIIRLIDFSGFKDINNIDLIVTSDLKNHLHFRFMLYSSDFRKTQKLYKQLSEYYIGSNIHSVRWAIIKEILRLLEGNLEMKLINKKYLRIDFELQALPIQEEEIKTKKFDFKFKLPELKLKLPNFKK
jgi:hypothetical protein